MLARIHPDDIEAIARRVVELQAETTTAEQDASLLSPSEVAKRIGRSADWVREHADELGVLRIGDGPRPRLYFHPALVDERLRERAECSGCTGPHAGEASRLEPVITARRVPPSLDGIPLRQVNPAPTSTKVGRQRANAPAPATGIRAPTRQQRSPAPGSSRARSAAPSPEEDRR